LAEGVATTFCGKLLSDLGAEVLMIEPTGGHPLRAAEPRRGDGVSARFLYLTTGKRSVVIDGTGDGDRRLLDLIGDSDLLITDSEPARVEDLAKGASHLVTVCIRPFGSTGPYADRRAHHLTLFHASGESSTMPSGLGWELFPDRPPIQLGSEIGYFDAGWNAAVAGIAACYDTLRSGQSEWVDVSIQESLLTVNRTRMNRFLNEGVNVGREKSRYGITGMMHCQDGWADIIGIREEQWDRLLALPEGAEFREAGFDSSEARAKDNAGLGDVLARWCAARPKTEVARVMSGIGAPAGIYADPADLLASEQLAHREFFHRVDDGRGGTVALPGAPYRLSRTPVSVRSSPDVGSVTGFEPRQTASRVETGRKSGRMLEGIRVLDFTWAAAGPYATLLLALLGADVVKIESAKRLDPARSGFIARYEGTEQSPIFNELNLNKRSIALDLTQPEDVAEAQRLVADFDIVVDNFRPGVMARFGLGPGHLLDRYPHLIVASSSANGSTGPEAIGAGLASIFAASGGLSDQTGYPDGPPTQLTDPMDYRAGTAFTVGILAALWDRDRTGRGQHVDFSSREVFAAGAPDALLAHLVGVPWQARQGNRHPLMAPHDVYACADGGWLAVAAGDDQERQALWNLVGPVVDGETADEAIRAWTASRQAPDAAASLRLAGVPASPVMSFADVAADPHLAARQVFFEVDHPVLGKQRVMRAPWQFSHWDCPVLRAGPPLGAHNDEVLGSVDRIPAD
jgi:crotonobetainyl-CoA:carnitine CoA-transferase CaiB-like acyl-CoA transferase